MQNATITTEGTYRAGVVVPKIKPSGRRTAIITFLPPSKRVAPKSDEEFWKEMEPVVRRIRKKLFRETYPALYADARRKRRTS